MKIIIHTIENNQRKNGEAVLNGLRVEVIDATAIEGSEKQVAWANEIREQSIVKLANKALATVAKSWDNGTHYNAEELDAGIARINNEMMPVIAKRLESVTSARTWIDNRHLDAAQISLKK